MKHGVIHVGKAKEFFASATRNDRVIKATNAKTVLYCPPAFLGIGFLSDAKRLNAAYFALAKKLGAILIPSLTAFALALKERPDLNLYEHDRHHPNPLGTYLIASLFYCKLFHMPLPCLPLESYVSRSPGLPRDPLKFPISKADREFLWSVARRSCTRSRRPNHRQCDSVSLF